MPTQPLVRSPKCTLPSRPRVMPSSRPMYWAKMRRGSTPRMMCAARSRCRMHRRSCGGHRPGRAGGHGLLAEPVVEAARAPCPGGRASSRALRCRASSASRAAGPTRSSVVRCSVTSGGNFGAGGFGRHLAVLSLRGVCAPPGIARGAPVRAAGSPLVLGVDGAVEPIRHGGLRLTPTMVESVRWRRLRWRLRGAWQWPAFVVLTVRRRGAGRAAAVPGRGHRRARRGAGRGLLQPARRRAAGAAARAWLLRRRRRDLPFMIARDYAGTALLVLIVLRRCSRAG